MNNSKTAINVEELLRIHQPISPRDFELLMGKNSRYMKFLRCTAQRYLDKGLAILDDNLKMVLAE